MQTFFFFICLFACLVYWLVPTPQNIYKQMSPLITSEITFNFKYFKISQGSSTFMHFLLHIGKPLSPYSAHWGGQPYFIHLCNLVFKIIFYICRYSIIFGQSLKNCFCSSYAHLPYTYKLLINKKQNNRNKSVFVKYL